MTDHEVMQMALEVLEFYQHRCNQQGFYSVNKQPLPIKAITQLRNQLAKPQGEWVDLTSKEINEVWCSGINYEAAVNAVIAKFKEKNTPPNVPQGEPVAWMNTNGAVNNKLKTHQFILPTTTIADLETTLKLIKTINYLVGIAERGEDRKMLDNETPEKFVLGYVKKLESSTPPTIEAAIEATKEKAAQLCDHLLKAGGGTYGDLIRSMK